MKNWQKTLIIVVVGFFVFGFLKNIVIQKIIESAGSNIVGAPIEIKSFSFSLLTQKVEIRGLWLYNPPNFPNEPFINFTRIRVDYDLGSLLKGKIHVPLIIIDLEEMVVVKDKNGKLNVDSLKIIEEQKTKKNEGKSKEAKDITFHIDTLKLNVDQVIMKDYTRGESPVIQVYDAHLKDKTIKNVNSVSHLVTMILLESMGPTAIKSAGLYAATAVLGVGLLPAGIVGVIVAKDHTSAEFRQSADKVYAESLKLFKDEGKIKSEDKTKRTIQGVLDGADVILKVEPLGNKGCEVVVSARQMMLAKPELAGGIIYKLQKKVK